MESLWNQADADTAVERYAAKGVGADLALRTYSARLLGREPRLVLHGGGNTSVKTAEHDIHGDPVAVLCVKGSGWDLATIEPAGHPAVRLEPLRRLRELAALSDEDMVNQQRLNLLDSAAPNPSVETLLHAFLPAKFIDHSHAWAVLSIADQPDAEGLVAEIYGDRFACVPYVMPGFALAKAAAEIYEQRPSVEGLVLLKHGVFTFGGTAREAYERMVACASAAEKFIAVHSRTKVAHNLAVEPRPVARNLAVEAAADVLPHIRGAFARAAGPRWPDRWVFDLRRAPDVMRLVDDERLADWAGRGVATPDHIIRTKRGPLVLPRPVASELAAWARGIEPALGAFASAYEAYFERQNARVGGGKVQLDPLPRVVAIPGVGLAGVGRSSAEAAVAADIAEAWVATLLDAEGFGRFEPVDEADSFDMEYWSLEQAKLGKAAPKRLAGQVAVVTGGAGAIGAATAKAFAAEGAEVAVLDLDGAAASAVAEGLGRQGLCVQADVTDPASVARAFEAVASRFGGVDIVVSNAGAAWTGAMADLPDETLRRSFELNFFAHQLVAQAAVGVFRKQGFGGTLLFNVSKQALNPGPDFGAYGTAKAALLALVRQYALEQGGEGVRCNAVNADRIRSGLLTEAMIAARAGARGTDAAGYMRGNLLGEEVTAEDVAQAFVFAALMRRTTGAVITVDGGNVAAMVR